MLTSTYFLSQKGRAKMLIIIMPLCGTCFFFFSLAAFSRCLLIFFIFLCVAFISWSDMLAACLCRIFR